EADFLAPSLAYISPVVGKYWNDYLLGNCTSKDIIHSVGNIDIVFTKPEDKQLFTHIQNKNSWSGPFSNRILEFLVEQDKTHDFIIIDNQGGRFFSSVTHSFFSDILICVLRPDKSDVVATVNYLKSLKKDFYLVWNQVLPHSQMSDAINEWIGEYFAPHETYKGTLGKIPFDEETAFQRWIQRKLFIKETPFTAIIEDIAKKLTEIVKKEEK
ncbi:MAG: MinD/ParA family protein, partial [Candidatus Hodarchaeota archaeon]